MKQKRVLTLMQARFVEGVISGKTQIDAAREAGYKQAASHAHRLMQRPAVQRAFEAAFECRGLSPEYLTGRLKELMEATDVQKNGYETPNWRGRARGIDLAMRLVGLDKRREAKEDLTYEELCQREQRESENEGPPEAED